LGISENQTDPDCFLIHSAKFSWEQWYQESTQFLNSNTTQQQVLCDCSRKNPFKP
jgi:hypothetical protein